MKIVIVGIGYVGLVSGTCFAEIGNNVVCVDKNVNKIDMLKKGIIPIYEPQLEELVKRNFTQGRIDFSSNLKNSLENTDIVFIAVGTPMGDDGSADLQFVEAVAKEIGCYMTGSLIIVDKSTVPVGTAAKVAGIIKQELKERQLDFTFDVVSNPEFLKEGAAVDDFMRPDRVVLGCDTKRAEEKMCQLYEPFVKNGHPVLVMDTKSAEITKYAANCMLATRISFMNEIALLCEHTGADINKIRKGIGTDSRIGMSFLYAGLGYGGSCLTKDVKALGKTFKEFGCESNLLKDVEVINKRSRELFIQKIMKHFNNDVKGLTFAVWGLAFKPNTDDIRDAPAVDIIRTLCKHGARIKAFDPHASSEAKYCFKDYHDTIIIAKDMYEATKNADALLLVTEWDQFKQINMDTLASQMKQYIIFDGRNIYDKKAMQSNGFQYYSIGR